MNPKAENALNVVDVKDMGKDHRFAILNIRAVLSFLIMLIFFGSILNGCAAMHKRAHDQTPLPASEAAGPPLPLDEKVEEALKFGKDRKPLAVVIAIDEEGGFQLYHSKQGAEGKAFLPNFPLHAGNIRWIDSMIIFRTTNDKVCVLSRRNMMGQDICLVWKDQ